MEKKMRNVHLISLVNSECMQQQQQHDVEQEQQQQRKVPLGHSCLKNLFCERPFKRSIHSPGLAGRVA